MRGIRVFMLCAVLISVFVPAVFCRAEGILGSTYVPEVSLREPKNDSVVDLAGKGSLVFTWDPVPMPAGGCDGYRFTLFKADGYDVVEKYTVEAGTLSVEVSSDKLESGTRYRWEVKQRDSRTLYWSRGSNMYFKVVKK